jgi:hypothetical protein
MAFKPLQIIPDSNIAGASFDEETKTLQIVYQRDSRTYEFYGPSADVAAKFENSGLKADAVYRAEIKSRFPYQEV